MLTVRGGSLVFVLSVSNGVLMVLLLKAIHFVPRFLQNGCIVLDIMTCSTLSAFRLCRLLLLNLGEKVVKMASEFIDKHSAYSLLKSEADSHLLPESVEAYNRAARIIDQMKPVYGEWLFYKQKNGYLWRCSLCYSNFENRFHYCPYCGAMMRS